MTEIDLTVVLTLNFGNNNAPPNPSVEPTMRRGKWGRPGSLSDP
jgi:hypothetical protein